MTSPCLGSFALFIFGSSGFGRNFFGLVLVEDFILIEEKAVL